NTSLPTGVPFVSIHEETGLTVPPSDENALAYAINRLAEDAVLREKYGKAAAQRTRTHFLEKNVLERLKEALTEKGG
ncbi:MAG: glycosyltransferase, partial [Ruminococcus sp.]